MGMFDHLRHGHYQLPSGTVVVFADICCPFTHASLKLLDARRTERGRADVAVHVRAWPLEVVNGAPLNPAMVAEEITALGPATDPAWFAGFSVATFPPTSLPALDLAAAAYEASVDTGWAVSLELRRRLFEQGQNIAEPAVLAEVAAAHGLADPGPSPDNTAALDDYDMGKRWGVTGSPHFFVGTDDFFCPALDIAHGEGGFTVALNRDRFEAFLTTAFG